MSRKNIKIKLMLNLLPTKQHLNLLYPSIITGINCIQCNTRETSIYWLICSHGISFSSIITTMIQQFFNSTRLDITNMQLS